MSGQTQPFWDQTTDLPAPAAADLPGRTRVCVVGAGIAGLTTAYLLAREGVDVLVLEARRIGAGETGRTTAHLASAIDDGFIKLEKWHGRERSALARQSHAAAIDRIASIVAAERIECEFRRMDAWLIPVEPGGVGLLERERAAAVRAGFAGAELETSCPYPGFTQRPALHFPNQAAFHPLHYLTGLAQAVERHGGRIRTGVRVGDVQNGEPATVITDSGTRVECDYVVIATNSPFLNRVALHMKQAAYRTYAIAFAVEPNAFPDALLWDTGDPYHYLRLSGTDRATCLIVGGEDHRTGQCENTHEAFQRLEAWARIHLPRIGPVRAKWSGQVMETLDGLGLIGRNPGDAKNVLVATGDSGMGMTHGTIAGILLTDLIQDRPNAWSELYDPFRTRLSAGRTFLQENANTARQYLDWVKIPKNRTPAPGSGCVVQRGLEKVALYRDPEGRLHAMSAVCRHLGCIVAWNAAENSWDCPCHGSRYDALGQVLNAPAASNLHPADPGRHE